MPKKVLYVEDDETIRVRYSKLMEKNGFQVLQAGTSADAKEIFLDEGDISLVVLDIDLNEKDQDGLDLGYWIKENTKEMCPEFVVVSSCDTYDHYQRSFRLGVAAFYPKNRISENTAGFLSTLLSMELRYQTQLVNSNSDLIEHIVGLNNSERDVFKYICEKIFSKSIDIVFPGKCTVKQLSPFSLSNNLDDNQIMFELRGDNHKEKMILSLDNKTPNMAETLASITTYCSSVFSEIYRSRIQDFKKFQAGLWCSIGRAYIELGQELESTVEDQDNYDWLQVKGKVLDLAYSYQSFGACLDQFDFVTKTGVKTPLKSMLEKLKIKVDALDGNLEVDSGAVDGFRSLIKWFKRCGAKDFKVTGSGKRVVFEGLGVIQSRHRRNLFFNSELGPKDSNEGDSMYHLYRAIMLRIKQLEKNGGKLETEVTVRGKDKGCQYQLSIGEKKVDCLNLDNFPSFSSSVSLFESRKYFEKIGAIMTDGTDNRMIVDFCEG